MFSEKVKFPSPYGVSFILIFIKEDDDMKSINVFPSSYEVSFILIYNNYSVYRSSSIKVSVSLWSIIHSYMKEIKKHQIKYIHSFRLLMEYHSFLYNNNELIYLLVALSFRLLMEYHSFLC